MKQLIAKFIAVFFILNSVVIPSSFANEPLQNESQTNQPEIAYAPGSPSPSESSDPISSPGMDFSNDSPLQTTDDVENNMMHCPPGSTSPSCLAPDPSGPKNGGGCYESALGRVCTEPLPYFPDVPSFPTPTPSNPPAPPTNPNIPYGPDTPMPGTNPPFSPVTPPTGGIPYGPDTPMPGTPAMPNPSGPNNPATPTPMPQGPNTFDPITNTPAAAMPSSRVVALKNSTVSSVPADLMKVLVPINYSAHAALHMPSFMPPMAASYSSPSSMSRLTAAAVMPAYYSPGAWYRPSMTLQSEREDDDEA